MSIVVPVAPVAASPPQGRMPVSCTWIIVIVVVVVSGVGSFGVGIPHRALLPLVCLVSFGLVPSLPQLLNGSEFRPAVETVIRLSTLTIAYLIKKRKSQKYESRGTQSLLRHSDFPL